MLSILGIISACAERSTTTPPVAPPNRDHLRVCGAVDVAFLAVYGLVGSSPRVRSGLALFDAERRAIGIISACAERSATRWKSCISRWDHLRVCGAVVVGERPLLLDSGSSPRVRSGQLFFIGIWSGWMVRNV